MSFIRYSCGQYLNFGTSSFITALIYLNWLCPWSARNEPSCYLSVLIFLPFILTPFLFSIYFFLLLPVSQMNLFQATFLWSNDSKPRIRVVGGPQGQLLSLPPPHSIQTRKVTLSLFTAKGPVGLRYTSLPSLVED